MEKQIESSGVKGSERDHITAAFGMVVTRYREALEMDQRYFARVAGLSNSHLRSIESGKTSPRLVTISQIAEAFGTDAGTLITEASRIAVECDSSLSS